MSLAPVIRVTAAPLPPSPSPAPQDDRPRTRKAAQSPPPQREQHQDQVMTAVCTRSSAVSSGRAPAAASHAIRLQSWFTWSLPSPPLHLRAPHPLDHRHPPLPPPGVPHRTTAFTLYQRTSKLSPLPH